MKHALITIGCTREYIDPVRYISNESSGRQGIALIKSLLKFNYKVICLHGYLQTKQIVSKNVKFIFTPTADEMLKEAKKYKSIDLGIFNAAVSKNCDYLVLNFPTTEDKIFNSKHNNGVLIGRSGDFLNLGNVTKTIFANKIVKYISNRNN